MEPQRAATELSQTLSLGSGGGYAGMPTASAPAEYYGAQAVAEDVVLPIVGAPYAGPPAAAAPSRSGSLAGRTASQLSSYQPAASYGGASGRTYSGGGGAVAYPALAMLEEARVRAATAQEAAEAAARAVQVERAASRTVEKSMSKKYVSELEVLKEEAHGLVETLHKKEKEVEAAENIESGLEMMKKSRADELEKATVAEKSKAKSFWKKAKAGTAPSAVMSAEERLKDVVARLAGAAAATAAKRAAMEAARKATEEATNKVVAKEEEHEGLKREAKEKLAALEREAQAAEVAAAEAAAAAAAAEKESLGVMAASVSAARDGSAEGERRCSAMLRRASTRRASRAPPSPPSPPRPSAALAAKGDDHRAHRRRRRGGAAHRHPRRGAARHGDQSPRLPAADAGGRGGGGDDRRARGRWCGGRRGERLRLLL